MTRPSLAGIEKRAAEATEGPWGGGRGCVVAPVDAPNAPYNDAANVRYYGGALIGESIARAEDRAFIADARTAVPALTAAVCDVLAECERFRFKGRGIPDDMPTEFEEGADAAATAILRALAGRLDLTDPEGDPT